MKNLANLRKKNKLTQMQLAKIMGVSTSTVAMWETGRRKPDYHTIAKLREYFAVGFEELLGVAKSPLILPEEDVEIPVAGYVKGGRPSTGEADILGTRLINRQLAAGGEIFALEIKGDSMEPKMSEGDIVIVRRGSAVASGRTAVVMVAGETTVKKIIVRETGLTLVPTNPKYLPMHYTPYECETLPVTIVGKVVELRCRYE